MKIQQSPKAIIESFDVGTLAYCEPNQLGSFKVLAHFLTIVRHLNKECLSYTTHAPNRLRININATRDYGFLHFLVKLSKLNTICNTCWFINLWKLSHTICSLGQEDDEDTPTSTRSVVKGHKLDLIAKVIASTLMCSVLLHSKDSCVTFTKSIHQTTSWSSCIISWYSCIIFSNFWACKDCDTTTSKPTCSKGFTLFVTSRMLLAVLYLDTRFKSSYYLMQLFTSISALLNVPFRLSNHIFIALQLFCISIAIITLWNLMYKMVHDGLQLLKKGVKNPAILLAT